MIPKGGLGHGTRAGRACARRRGAEGRYRLRARRAGRIDQARLLDSRDGDRAARAPPAGLALHGPLDDVRCRVLVHGARDRDLFGRSQPREDRPDHADRLRALHRLRDVRRLPRLAHRADARAAHPLDLRDGRLLAGFGLRPRRTTRLGGIPGRSARADLGRLLQLGPRRAVLDPACRPDDLQQPLRLHRNQRLRALSRDADPDRLGDLHGREGLHRRRRPPEWFARGQWPAGLGRGHRGDRVRDVGQRAGRLALRQAALRLADVDVSVRRPLVPALHDGRLDDGEAG